MFFLRKYKPRSPGTRNRIVSLQFDFLKKQKFLFFFKLKYNCSGRNSSGRITIRHKSGGSTRKRLLIIDRIRLDLVLMFIILGVYKQKPNMCHYGLIRYSNGVYSYIPLAHKLKITSILPESNLLVKHLKIPVGVLCFFLEPHITYVFFNICSISPRKSLYARAAGTFCKFILRNLERNILKIILPSKKVKLLTINYFATVGRASNIYAYKFRTGKAGVSRNLGIRPTTRGVAMNAFDHPNGGRTKTNKPEKTP